MKELISKRQALVKDTWTPIGHSVICPKHGPLVETKRHCHNIARLFLYSNPHDSNPIASWFQIASGIKEVTYISDLFDDEVIWCGTAIEYENAKSKFHSKLIKELTRFNFIWGGFEAYCESMDFPSCPDKKRRGIVPSTNYILKTSYENKLTPILFYQDIIDHLKKMIAKNTWYGNVNELFASDNCTSENLVGLKVVYQIRNLFAHGAFTFSEPSDWNSVRPYDIEIINSSSRILLMSIQMLFLATHPNLKFNVAKLHHSEESGVAASKFLTKMHLKSYRYS